MAAPGSGTARARSCVLLLLIAFSVYLLVPHRPEEIHQIYQNVRLGKKGAFMETAIATAIDGPYDARPLKSLCARKKWTEGLIFACMAPQGGVGNVRNVILNCVRYAIEAGAGFILPQIVVRSDSDVKVLSTDRREGLSYLFDVEIFVASLEEACPQMKIFKHLNDLYDVPSAATPLHLTPQDLSREFVYRRVLAHPAEWRGEFDKWVQSQTTPMSREFPVIVRMEDPLFQFPITYDTPRFAANFGRILPFRADARRLAAAALFELSQRFSLNIDPAGGIVPQAFMGAHLRTAADAAAAHWPGYDDQASTYIGQALAANLTIIYVSSGNPDDIVRLQKHGSYFSVTVVSKQDLLSAEEREVLNAMTWDQQALMDYEVLLKSSIFGGITDSSFAFNIALRRNLLSSKRDYLHWDGDEYFHEDELSSLYGGLGLSDFCTYGMWP